MTNRIDILIKAPSGNYVAAWLEIEKESLAIFAAPQKSSNGLEEATDVLESIKKMLEENDIPHEAYAVNMAGGDKTDQLRLLLKK